MSEKPVAPIKTFARYEPDTVYIGTGEYVAECVRADDGDYYLAADVDADLEAAWEEVAALQAEIAALREERDALREALAGLITWIPSADTYRRLGFDPEAPMRALEEARAALSKENRND